jgi:hypothetical protein
MINYMYATSRNTVLLATLRVILLWPTIIYHLQSRPAEQLTARQNVSHQNTPPFFCHGLSVSLLTQSRERNGFVSLHNCLQAKH